MNFKTPSRFMAGLITMVLISLYSLVLLAPMLFPGKMIEFDPALVQTLLTLVVVSVTYYIGTSSASQAKDETIAVQAATAAALPTPPTPPPLGVGPTGKPDDPVTVTPVSPPP